MLRVTLGTEQFGSRNTDGNLSQIFVQASLTRMQRVGTKRSMAFKSITT